MKNKFSINKKLETHYFSKTQVGEGLDKSTSSYYWVQFGNRYKPRKDGHAYGAILDIKLPLWIN